MISFKQGDIFKSEAQTLVATVNCVGVMGKGLAKEFKQRYPDMFKEYAKACKRGELQKGKLFIYDYLNTKILCFPTKDNWKGPSKYEFIEEGLITLRDHYENMKITSIAIPPLGSGLGGLRWDKVRSLIEKYLKDLPIDVEIYEPLDNQDRIPRKNPFRDNDKIKITPGAIYTGEMIRKARNSFPPEMKIGRLLLQKIAFFSQMAGLPIKLNFHKYKLGPYDYRLKFNVDRLEGIYVRDASPTIQRSDLQMLNEDEWISTIEILNSEVDLTETRRIISSVVDFLRAYSLIDIELLSTVYLAWSSVVASGSVGSDDEIIKFIREWKLQKFDDKSIVKALESLSDSDWIPSNKTSSKEEPSLGDMVFT